MPGESLYPDSPLPHEGVSRRIKTNHTWLIAIYLHLTSTMNFHPNGDSRQKAYPPVNLRACLKKLYMRNQDNEKAE